MQRTAERDAHLLKAAADSEQRHSAFDAGFNQRQRERVAVMVVGLVLGMLFQPEARGMDVGTRAGQKNAVHSVEQGADVGDLRCAGEHQRQRAGDVRDRPQIALADHLRRKAVLDDVHIGDDADDRFPHCMPLDS